MRTDERPIRDALRLLIWYPFRLFARLAPNRAVLATFPLMGRAQRLVSRRKTRALTAVMRSALGSVPADTAARYYANHYLDRLHIFLYPDWTTWERLARFVVLEGRAHLDDALAAGHGALIVQPHFGPVQITLLALGLLGYRPLQIGLPSARGLSRIGRAVAFAIRRRYEARLPPIHPADRFLGPVVRHLKQGGVALTTGDGAGGGVYLGAHERFAFLGRQRLFPLGPAELAHRTDAVYLPTFLVAERYDRLRLVFERPIPTVANGAPRAPRAITQDFIAVFERYLRAQPHAWHFWDELDAL